MDDGDDGRGTRCALLWVDNAADLAAMIWAGFRLAAAVRRRGDCVRWTKYCGGNVGELEPADLPGWLMFWVDGDGESELMALNRLGYRSAGPLRCDVMRIEPGSDAAAAAAAAVATGRTSATVWTPATGRTPDAAVTVAPGRTTAALAAAPEAMTEARDRDGPAAPEEAAAPGCELMSYAAFASEMCCGSCTIM